MPTLHFLANPARFRRFSARVLPALSVVTALAVAVGLYWALVIAPPDYQQGETVRIMFIHVPAATIAMGGYVLLATLGASLLVWRHPLAALMARATAPVGATFTAVGLITGSLWGRPMWGTWWVWDARLTSYLILLFLYLGYIALVEAIDDTRRADQAGALLAVVGAVNVPIIYYSVRWWNTLHQGATISASGGVKMADTMLMAMLLMTLACWAYAFAVVFMRARAIVVEREQHTAWVSALAQSAKGA